MQIQIHNENRLSSSVSSHRRRKGGAEDNSTDHRGEPYFAIPSTFAPRTNTIDMKNTNTNETRD